MEKMHSGSSKGKMSPSPSQDKMRCFLEQTKKNDAKCLHRINMESNLAWNFSHDKDLDTKKLFSVIYCSRGRRMGKCTPRRDLFFVFFRCMMLKQYSPGSSRFKAGGLYPLYTTYLFQDTWIHNHFFPICQSLNFWSIDIRVWRWKISNKWSCVFIFAFLHF